MAETNSEKKPAHEVICDEIKNLSYKLASCELSKECDVSTDEGFRNAIYQRVDICRLETSMDTLLDVLSKIKIPPNGFMYICETIGELEGRLGRSEDMAKLNSIIDEQDRSLKAKALNSEPNIIEQ